MQDRKRFLISFYYRKIAGGGVVYLELLHNAICVERV